MPVWDVFGKRTAGDGWALVGGIKAPDAEMALVLAAPNHRDPSAITDPIAVFGTDSPDLERPVTAFGLALAA